jgi:hypothetical protein
MLVFILIKVASWKRGHHLEASEPIEWVDPALAQIFKGLNDRDWKFSKGMQLAANVSRIDAKHKMLIFFQQDEKFNPSIPWKKLLSLTRTSILV